MFHKTLVWLGQQFRSWSGLARIAVLTVAVAATGMGGWHRLVADSSRWYAPVVQHGSFDPFGPPGKLTLLSTASHNFGFMDQEKQGTHSFEIQNDGAGDLVIELLDKSCGCTNVKLNGHAMETNLSSNLGLPPLLPAADASIPDLNSAPGSLDFPLADSIPVPPELPEIDINELLANLPDPTSTLHSTHGSTGETGGAPHVLRAGEKATVELSWTTGLKNGPVRQFVRIGTSDPIQPFVDFSIEGEVVPMIGISESQIRILNARQGEPSRATFHIFSGVLERLDLNVSTSSNELISARFEPMPEDVRTSLNAKTGYVGIIEVAPGLPIGPFHAELVIATNIPERPEVRVSAYGQVEGDVVVVPSDQMDFQLVPHNKPRTRTLLVKIQNGATEGLRVARVTPDFLKFELHTAKSDNGGSPIAIVEITVPTGSPMGAFDGAIELEGTDTSALHVRIPVRGQVIP